MTMIQPEHRREYVQPQLYFVYRAGESRDEIIRHLTEHLWRIASVSSTERVIVLALVKDGEMERDAPGAVTEILAVASDLVGSLLSSLL